MKLVVILSAVLAIGYLSPQKREINNTHNSGKIKIYQQDGKHELSFSSSVKYGKQKNQMSVLISSDFDGNYNEENVRKATWENVAPKVKLSSNDIFENSGPIDVSGLVKKGKPFYIAFKYDGAAHEDNPQRTWFIKDVKIGDMDIQKLNWLTVPQIIVEQVGLHLQLEEWYLDPMPVKLNLKDGQLPKP
ncbi:hypothetical protein A5893_07535 [Pedobacter psychrophilus]|uniref:DUF5017 domain-containing protein n=1 Tax=Pedobacter psychrophilus TaxID=1826909 RepID=A0A179DIE2_9SPHI|nr:DUF5017 domain-containing protein [Pedobacter psychrophilus]OAQ40781.1 hypothetical protein A5893_07535 [Pedobacter psychrophilus]